MAISNADRCPPNSEPAHCEISIKRSLGVVHGPQYQESLHPL
jgi:hypothetical protein